MIRPVERELEKARKTGAAGHSVTSPVTSLRVYLHSHVLVAILAELPVGAIPEVRSCLGSTGGGSNLNFNLCPVKQCALHIVLD